jgi:pectinesterase
MKKFLFVIILTFPSLLVLCQERRIVVAADGTGEFTSVQEAVNSIRAYMSDTTFMFIKNGTYREKVIIPSWVTNLFMKGEH